MTFHPDDSYNVVMKNNKAASHTSKIESSFYLIRILGEFDQERNAWFTEIGFAPIVDQVGMTTLKGMIKDQAHLRGILNRIWDLNFTIVLVKRLETTGGTDHA